MPHRSQFNSDADFLRALRDYFAAKAMSQGMAILVAHNNNLNEHQLMHLAKVAYSTADAMLAAREVTKS